MRKEKYIRVSTAMGVVLAGGCGECKLRKSECCEGCRTQTILDLLDDVAKTGGVEISQRHRRLIDADKLCQSVQVQMEIIRRRGIDEMVEIADLLEKCFLQEVENAETIIPADGGDGG